MNIFCNIDLWGLTTQAKLEDLFWGSMHDFSYTIDSFLDTARKGERVHIQGVSVREVQSIDTALLRTGLGYRLVNSNGGVSIWDPVREERHTFALLNGGTLHLPADILDHPEQVEKARRGRALFEAARRMPLEIADTAHEMVELIANQPELAPFAKTFSETG
jgi:hypothetical protein